MSILYESQELEQIILLSFEHCCNYSRADLVLKQAEQLSQKSTEQLDQILNELKRGIPIQYVLGYSWFMDHKLIVSPDVLIPRPETEELVSWVIKDYKDFSKSKLNVLDICTGSGCIPISLSLKFIEWEVIACDISEKALSVAIKNNELLKSNVKFVRSDILKWRSDNKLKALQTTNSDSTSKFDIIISNPPYVLETEKASMHERVLNHEPSIALFVPDEDPLIFYREIAAFAANSLCSGAKLYVEINRDQAADVIDLFKVLKFSDIILKKDLYNNARMISATFKY